MSRVVIPHKKRVPKSKILSVRWRRDFNLSPPSFLRTVFTLSSVAVAQVGLTLDSRRAAEERIYVETVDGEKSRYNNWTSLP